MNHQVENPTREDILARVDDWEARLLRLRENIEVWAVNIEGANPLPITVPQVREKMMGLYQIPPRRLPAVAVVQGRNRVSFVPLALWAIGANGRVNITTNSTSVRHRYMLVDGSAPGSPENWTVVSTSRRNCRIPLDEDVLRRLLRDEDLFEE